MNPDLSDLPDEVRELIEPHVAPDGEMLDAIGLTIAHKRDEAKVTRTSSGIEQIWKECEEAYVGIDDANRLEFQDAKWSKPMSMDGPVSTGRSPRQTDHKSTAFLRVTARYVDAGAAKLGEILLPSDDKAFSLSETPVPELIKAKEDTSQVVHDGMGNVPLTRPAKPGEIAPGGPPPGAPTMGPPQNPIPPAPLASPTGPTPVGPSPSAPGVAPAGGAVLPAGATAPPQVPLTVKDLAEENIELARKKAKAAETRIYGWMVDCQYSAEMRKVIFDSARIGVGILKGPFPKPSQGIVVKTEADDSIDLQIEEKLQPAVKWVDPWNVFPDPACGENIRDGDYIFERDYLSERQVEALKKLPGYIEKQISKVIIEGPNKANVNSDEGSSNSPEAAKRKDRYEIWYFYGVLNREEMDCINIAAHGKPLGSDEVPPDKRQVHAIVTLINDCVIRATINPLDSGSLPYHSMPWQRRTGNWAGIGVAEQIRTPQRMLNAANRAMLNNAGKSAGSQIIVDQSGVKPADGNWILTPDKIWLKTADAPGQDVRQNFAAVEIPNMTDPLMKIIEFALQMAEESTSIPLVTQGQSGETTPDTFGATRLQDNNANQLLRSIGYTVDDNITEPIVRQFYEWLLLDPDVPNEEKGEFTINAHGSAALVERAIQDQTIAQMGPMVLNPAYKINPAKWAKMMIKSKRLDPADLLYTDEEQARIDAQPPPVDPRVQVAQINAGVERDKLVVGQQADQRTTQNEQAIAAAAQALEGKKVDTEQSRLQVEATVKLHEQQTRRELAMLEYANRRGINLDQVKADLAKTAMTLNAQRELNAADNAVALHKQFQGGSRQPRHRKPGKPSKQAAQPVPVAPMSKVIANNGRAPNGEAFEQ